MKKEFIEKIEKLNLALYPPLIFWMLVQFTFTIDSKLVDIIILIIYSVFLLFEVIILNNRNGYSVSRLLGFYTIMYFLFGATYSYINAINEELPKIQFFVLATLFLKFYSDSKPLKMFLIK